MSASILTKAFYQRLQVPFLHKNVYVNFFFKKRHIYKQKNLENKMKKEWGEPFLQSQESKAARKLLALWLETTERQFWAFFDETKVGLIEIDDDRWC